MKKALRFFMSKLFIITAVFVAEFSLLTVVLLRFCSLHYLFGCIAIVVKMIFMIKIVSSDMPPAYKISWLSVILINAVAGGALYFFFGRVKLSAKAREKMRCISEVLENRSASYENSIVKDHLARKITRILSESCYSAAFSNCKSEFLESGEAFFESLFKELEGAEKYICLDYFIISGGLIWERLFEIIEKSISRGVDVMLVYDDIGSILHVDRGFLSRLEKSGMKIKVFNKISHHATSKQNNRDHRKVCIIDGKCVFIGGINLSDEYANITSPFGHWKDSGVLLKGPCTEAYLNEFFATFDALLSPGCEIPYPDMTECEKYASCGIVAPYFDCPFENRQVFCDILCSMIAGAKESLYITTPYFVPDNNVERELKKALLSGVKVKIIIPGIYDKWYVRELSRFWAEKFALCGAEIYEYTRGFIHQKMFMADGRYVICGSSNLDHRSLYLSFESGAFMYETECIKDILSDFEKTLDSSAAYFEKRSVFTLPKKFLRHIFALFAPLV